MAARDGYRRTRDTLPVDALVHAVLEHHVLVPEIRAHKLIIEWGRLVGPQLARVTAPDGLRDGVLSVWVKTSTWMQELRLLKDRVIADINLGLGDPPLVRDLRLHFGSARLVADGDYLARLRRDRDRLRPPPPKVPVGAPPERAAAIAREAALVEDPELAALIREVRTRHDR
ncbi:MAG: DUF721 domain-containing protein [Kofleriaceae bacterium]